jgi:hypothetical protein
VTLITNSFLGNENSPKVHYRMANMTSGKFNTLSATWDGENYVAYIPVVDLNTEFDLLVYFTFINKNGLVTMHPGLFHEKHLTPYYTIKYSKNN